MLFIIKINNPELQQMYSNKKNNQTDSGIDLYLPEEHTIPPKTFSYCIDLQIQYEIVNEHSENIASFLLPRSSIYKYPGLMLANSIGLIDAEYRGNIKAYVHNLSDEPIHLPCGIRLFQIVNPSLTPMNLDIVDTLSETTRDQDGFGSTGA